MFLKLKLGATLFFSFCLFASYADNGEAHLKKYRKGIANDPTIVAAKKLNIKIPIMAREWHVWWGAPLGAKPHMPTWMHWKGQRLFGQFNQATTIEKTRPSSQWRRWLNCVGYPLLGPYDSSQPDIIRWQLETAKNAGIECLHLQLWPTIWDEGIDFMPLPIFDAIMETAAQLNYPIAVHDEIQFRRPKISKAQTLKSSIQRSILLLKRYGQHPGWYKIDGMPVYYFQNWSRWMSARDLESYFATVEKAVGKVYWVVEMADIESYYKIPQIKAIVSHSNGWFLHTSPYGAKPHPWEKLLVSMNRAAKLARKYGKKFGVQVKTRFNHTHDRGSATRPQTISGEDGMFYVNSVMQSMKSKPDFLVMSQWNDFEEGAFIEPAWDYDGNNGDPYRYCRITAALSGKTFTPARLPARTQLDPFIRKKLFGDTKPGDMGPVFQEPKVANRRLQVKWAKDSNPKAMSFFQSQLATWKPGINKFDSAKLRLANYSAMSADGLLKGGRELRFYAPGLATEKPLKLWLGIRLSEAVNNGFKVRYRSNQEFYRRNCQWWKTKAGFGNGYAFQLKDGTVFYWTPLYDAIPDGREGDFIISTAGNIAIREIVIWSPEMMGTNTSPSTSMVIPEIIDLGKTFVATAYDAVNNPGPPMLILPADIIISDKELADMAKKSKANAVKNQAVKRIVTNGGFTETFANLSEWRKLSGGKPRIVQSDRQKPGVPLLLLPNSVVATALPKPLKSLSLKIDIFNQAYRRGQWVALFDKDYKHGIGVLWDSSLDRLFNGQGFVTIITFDNPGRLKVGSSFKRLTKTIASGTMVSTKQPLTISMEISPEKVIVRFNGKELQGANPFKSTFTSVVLRGNGKGYFDNLIVKAK